VMVASIFVFVMLCFGAVESPWVLAAIPCAALGGLSVAIPLSAYSVTMEREGGFAAVNRFVLTPMMLFAGAFFPVTQLPIGFRVFAYLTPMWHSVDLCRSLALDQASALRTAGHVAVLLAFASVGYLVSRRNYARVLTP
jgi:lipooligosaccharide transport system permease protein